MSIHDHSSRSSLRSDTSSEPILGQSLELRISSTPNPSHQPIHTRPLPVSDIGGFARHTLGLVLLLVVVFLWTASNFLGSVSLVLSTFASVD